MAEANRYIIEAILKGKIKSRKDLQKMKLEVCREYQLDKFPSNSAILNNATEEEKKKIFYLLKKKPTRTMSGVAVVAVMCPPHQCPHGRCFYCPESDVAPPSYTGEEPAALRARMFEFHPYRQVYNRLLQLGSIGHPLDKVELIIMGGTFASQPLCFQEWFVTRSLEAMNDFGKTEPRIVKRDHQEMKIPSDFRYLDDVQLTNEKSKVRCVGMTFETRPDYSKIEDVDRMLQLGGTRVELGVQTIYNFIYHRMERGHRVEDVVEANQILRDSGMKVAMHLMPGLFSNPQRDLRIFHRVFNDSHFQPDMLKIYPCLVTKGSKLHQMWENGEYHPYSTEEAVDLIVKIKKILPKWVRTMRIQRDIPSPLIEAGVKKSNLGELVYRKLEEEKVQCQCIRCREVGRQASRGIYPNLDRVKVLSEEYESVGGKEIFISTEDPKNQVLLGFLRLRIPSENAHRIEVTDKTALVRELHVYGPMIPLGEKEDDLWQHRGYGEELLAEAERMAMERNDKNKVLITSGIGVRDYYRKFDYQKEGPYMSKILD
ncbi:MAG TPA: tRNA uridine(34) 5-carboxymethylaminomethyl modification radical SAM/GNAT enzyme Elp3 [Methanobacteriaceae archaeon]|nr:tRNA uridine(34) 5-carboxymethylaminomethyl modification radical SAM/GNAT enzyme Elp3 [Methanobacteriaceae archaeon]